MSNNLEHTILVKCQLKNLQLIRSFVNKKLSDVLEEKERNLLVLAVDEVCSNLIIHSNDCNDEANLRLTLKLERTPEGVLFEILDHGRFFNYLEYDEPSMEEVVQEKRKGSIGLILVRKIMDKVEFVEEESYNVCRLFKRLDFKSVA